MRVTANSDGTCDPRVERDTPDTDVDDVEADGGAEALVGSTHSIASP